MWQGFTNFQFALGIDLDALRDELPARIDRAVAAFLRLHRSGG